MDHSRTSFPPRIGVLGGTFDPVHYGHLRIAEAARERLHLSRVLFVPNRSPVHKDHCPAPAEDRFAMLVLATHDHPQFEVSRIELDRETPSFAIETMERLRADHLEADLFFITGADEILSLRKWKASERLLEIATFAAAPRYGYDLERLPAELEPDLMRRVVLLKMQPSPVTSTEIRKRTAQGLSIRYETPEAVANYIRKRGLYCD
jgi:nicotinate-nucleotide adenylyltransferase